MNTAPKLSPADLKQNADAHDLGKHDGYRYWMVREDLVMPRGEWKCLVEQCAINPWSEDEVGPGCPPEVAARLAKRWAEGFVLGTHKAQADIRRGAGNRSTT